MISMMDYFLGTIAHGSTGLKTISVGFQPQGMRITVAQKFGAPQSYMHSSVGVSDGVDQYCTSLFQDTTGGLTQSVDTKIVSHYERAGGILAEVLAATFHSFTATQVKYTITTANANYNLLVEVWG